ncbi:MAG TPA: HmuY family protein [Polyangiales bacterium]|nr:HmuY family protein [Polyangiales bacterium]
MFHHNLFIALIVFSTACASDASEPEDKKASRPQTEAKLDQTETPLPDGIPEKQDDIVNRGRAGVIETVVDAQLEEEWRKLDLDTGEQSDDENAWDLSFSRSRILINGGMSGPGSVSVATLTKAFDAVKDVPAEDEFHGEEADSTGEKGDADTLPDNPLYSSGDDWFVYNIMTHELTPREVTFVVKSTEDRYFKLRFIGYYDRDNGTPGVITLRWIELE